MKCSDCQKLLPLYLENESGLEEKQSIEAHFKSCTGCRTLLLNLQDESDVVGEAIGFVRLPNSLARSILDQLEPYPAQRSSDVFAATPSIPSQKRRKATWKKIVTAACAAVFLAITAGTFISPAFAAYVSSFISRIGGDLGLERAVELGFGIPVNQTVTDQGITLRIKDIVADPTRLVVSYVLEDEKGEVLPNLFVPAYSGNRIYLTDDAGNIISSSPSVFQQGTGFADYMFMLKNTSNNLVVHFDIASLKPAAPKQGSWKLDVPVDLANSKQASKDIPIEKSYSSPHGIDFTLEMVTYGPSATRFTLATRRTPEEEERVKKIREQIVGLGSEEGTLGGYSLEYHIEDKDGRIVASQSTAASASTNRHVYFNPGYSSLPEKGVDDSFRWYGAFVPSETPEKLWFVLESIEKTEQADFSILFRPKDLTSAAVNKEYAEASSTYSVKQMTKGTDPETKEPLWMITLTGTLTESDFPEWKLQDEIGRSYAVKTDYSTSSVTGYKDRAKVDLEQTLIVKGLSSLPEQLTLTLQTIKKRYTDVDWKVAIPPGQ